MKKLCRFYCVDCDNAFMELVDVSEEKIDITSECEYCRKKFKAEEISDEKDN